MFGRECGREVFCWKLGGEWSGLSGGSVANAIGAGQELSQEESVGSSVSSSVGRSVGSSVGTGWKFGRECCQRGDRHEFDREFDWEFGQL